jgi:hypothetical protein
MRQFNQMVHGCTLLVLLFAGSAFAKGGEVGNGGDVFQCQNTKSTLVDIYEADAQRGIKLDLGPPRLALFSKIDMALKRLARLSPIRAKMYSDQAHNFFNDASLIPGAQLTPIQDVYNWVTPDGCVLRQIAVQIVPQFPQDKRYLVDKDLWDTLDDDSKAALILHEVIYREAISLGFTNSISVRYFNSLIFSHELDQATPETFVQTLYSLPFRNYEVGGNQFDIGALPTDGSMTTGLFTYSPDGQITSFQGTVWNSALGKSLTCIPFSGCAVHFDSTGAVSSAEEVYTAAGQVLLIEGNFIFGKDWSIETVYQPHVFRSLDAIYPIYRLSVKSLSAVNFDQNGNLTYADWQADVQTPLDHDEFAIFFNGMIDFIQVPTARINFDLNGMIRSVHSDIPVDLYVRTNTNLSIATPYDELWMTDLSISENNGLYQLQSVPSLAKEFYYRNGMMDDPQSGRSVGVHFKEGTQLNFQQFLGAGYWNVESGTLGRDEVLRVDNNGGTKSFPAGTVVHFDMNGVVVPSGSR